MKNLNRTIERASMPKLNAVTPVNRKFIYSLCAALLLLTGTLSTKAQCGSGTNRTTDYHCLPYTLGFSGSNSAYFQDSACTSCSPLTNTAGDAIHSGSDEWIRIDIADAGYLSIIGGTSDFDSVFYLYDDSENLITSADDGYGASGQTHWWEPLQPGITYISVAANSTYYLRVDGTDKYGEAKSGTVGISYWLQ